MKKQILFLAALLVITAGTTLAALPAEVNGPISDKLRSLENANTKASLELVSLEADEARATAAAFKGSFEKTGSKNSVRLNLENASYAYGEGSGPTTHAVGSLDLDLTKTLPRYQINLFVPQLDSLLSIGLRQYAKRYGNAVSIKVKTSEKKKDAEGNWAFVKGTASFAIDMTKLPAGTTPESMAVKSGTINLEVNVTSGMRFDITLVGNPAYAGLQAGEAGLKEKLDKIAARDEEVLKEIEDVFNRLDKNLTPIVEATVSPF